MWRPDPFQETQYMFQEFAAQGNFEAGPDGLKKWVNVCEYVRVCTRGLKTTLLLRIFVMTTTLIPHSPLLQILDDDHCEQLWKAWRTDWQRERLVKAKMLEGVPEVPADPGQDRCIKDFFYKKETLLSLIHDDAMKLQTMISKQHKCKAEYPLKKSINDKVRRDIPYHYCLRFVRQYPMASILTRVAQHCSSHYSVFGMRRI
jgi:hypothetical protein